LWYVSVQVVGGGQSAVNMFNEHLTGASVQACFLVVYMWGNCVLIKYF